MFAIFRGHPNKDLAELGEKHMQHDLQPEDRARLRKAASKVSTHATVGSLLGLGLGLAMAWRIRQNRQQLFNAFRMMSKPTEVVFANGRRETVPDLEPLLRPTRWGDIATYTAFALGGSMLGGETGLLTGSAAATSTITRDPISRQRIENAFRLFQIDVLKRQLNGLERESKESEPSSMDSWERLKDQAGGMVSSLKPSSSH
ncbi:hypothetical protein QBC32DRAFT_354334 [Pseudoneurospora amorphoporcata]|uniref:Uncharacterized protein n=1 Tax=Pseudoneurospora amorphoporcata TaxID=241081 RepID=A0AAN6NPG4_9PEZI|nr:hypothetical protein QBC32DRAFT_354334 [Pseudoneurospora amorphoporcata]